MFLKRLALTTSIAALAVAGGASNAAAAGLTYGAASPDLEREAWLRLGPQRGAIASVFVDFFAPARRCTHGQRGYFSSFVSGYEWDEPIVVRPNGSFAGRVDDRVRLPNGRRARERASVTGTVTKDAITLSVQGIVDFTGAGKPNARCTFGPQNWVLHD